MSKVTNPILLDSTGQDINATLRSIQYALQCRNTIIDDEITSDTLTWSSKKIADALTSAATETGAEVTIEPIAATPIDIVTTVAEQTTLVITHTGNDVSKQYEAVIPAAGEFHWTNGDLILPDGSVANLEGFSIMAFEGPNTLTVNEGTMKVSYHVIGFSSGGSCDCSWSVISGGTAAEEG